VFERRPPLIPHRFALGLALLVAAPAWAQEGALALRQQSLAATCAACHGSNGKPPATATLPALAGMPAAELIAQMKAFRSGARPATVMRQLALGYSDAQLEALGAFFASQPR
jgi:cytochrome subunit of sulfide dehydrogenase